MTVTGVADEHGYREKNRIRQKIAFGCYKIKNGVKKENKN